MHLVAAQRAVSADPTPVRSAWPVVDRRLVLAVAAVVLAGAGAVVASAAFSGAAQASLVGDPGAVTRWGLLLTRTAHDVAAMGTLGVLAVAVLLLPRAAGAFAPDAQHLVRLSSRWAAAWAAAGLLGLLLSLSEATGMPLQDVLRPDVLALGLELPNTRALVSTVWLAGLVAVWARWTRSPAGGCLLLLTAVAALLPPLITGHAAHQEEHTTAVVSLALHVGAAALWVGGLLALALHLRRSPMALQVVLPRYSRMALVCFVVVALSGTVTGWTAFAELAQVWSTTYGQLLLAKVAALGVLGAAGVQHRRRTLRAVAAGRPRAFLSLAVAELALMAAVAGLAVGLSHTPPPPSPEHAAVAAEAFAG